MGLLGTNLNGKRIVVFSVFCGLSIVVSCWCPSLIMVFKSIKKNMWKLEDGLKYPVMAIAHLGLKS